jgi:negative regulator of sigma E activity
MINRWAETLSRLIDGDSVDAAVVAEALESADGRRLLVEFAAVRAAVNGDTATPSAGFYDRMQARLATAERQPARPARAVSLWIAAASVAASLLLGFGIERWRHLRVDAPPSAARVLRFDTSEWTSAKRGAR